MGKHCGYQGKGFFAKLSRAVIPDKPLGVNIANCCACHDIGWDKEANKRSDIKLKDDILDAFYIHANNKSWSEMNKTLFFYFAGYPTAYIYYLGVRIGGIPVKIKYRLSK